MANLLRSVGFLGISFSTYNLPQLLDAVSEGVTLRDNRIISNHNLHSIFLFHRSEKLRSFYRLAHSSHIDGMPLVWMARIYGHDVIRANRITYVDFLPPLLDRANRNNWSVYYLGSRTNVCIQGSSVIQELYPAIRWKAHHGYFDVGQESADNRRIVNDIKSFAPDVMLVGMGMPRQEEWIADHHHEIGANVILPCGAAVDYIAGAVPRPPRWAGRCGLEWLFRLAAEPSRLASRYLVEPWFIFALILREWARKKNF